VGSIVSLGARKGDVRGRGVRRLHFDGNRTDEPLKRNRTYIRKFTCYELYLTGPC